jgi:hypothetical protein
MNLFVDDDDIAAVATWLQALDQNFVVKCFSALVSCRDNCHNSGGDYVINNVMMSGCVRAVVSVW